MGVLSVETRSRAEYQRAWYNANRLRVLKIKAAYRARHPWRQILAGMNQRCNNPACNKYKIYGARGIKNLLDEPQIHALWVRDRADLLERPSLDRIDPNGDYEFSNCQFIELKENSLRSIQHRIRRQDGTFS